MYDSITVSAQLLVLADRLGFGKICSGENADKRYRHFTARTQLYAMMIAQLTGQKGLRTIEETIASDNDLYHAGVSIHITRTNLAHANEKSPCVELFFKMIKQNLRVKRFYGQSENSVKTQVWIALIVHLLFLILKAETRQDNRTFSSFCSEISVVLFKHRNLEKWFARDYEKSPPKLPPDKNSLWLFDDLAG